MQTTKLHRTVVLGGGSTGKSSLTLRYMGETSTEEQPNLYRKSVEVDGQRCNLEVLDTAGADPFTSMNEMYIRATTAFILMFNITRASSMSELENLRKQIFDVKRLKVPKPFPLATRCQPGGGRGGGQTLDNSKEDRWSIGGDLGEEYHYIPVARRMGSVLFVIVGTKCDLVEEREVSREMAIRMATLWGVPYYETSAQLNINVDSVFLDIIRQMRQHDIVAGTMGARLVNKFCRGFGRGSPIRMSSEEVQEL